MYLSLGLITYLNNMNTKDFLNKLIWEFRKENTQYLEVFNEHIELIEISKTEYTWVWCYINILYKHKPTLSFWNIDILGLKKLLYINNISTPFDVELNIYDAQISFIEIVTYWDIIWNWEVEKIKFE